MSNEKLPKPTPADYEKRVANNRLFTEGTNPDQDLINLEFLDSIDWSAEIFEQDGKYGVKTALGEMVLPPVFDNFWGLTSSEIKKGDRVVAVQNGKCGVAIADGTYTWLVKPEYDFIGYPNQITHVKKDGKWGLLDIINGKFLISLECDSIDDYMGFPFSNGIGFYEKGGKTGVITQFGTFTEPIFEEVEKDSDGDVKVKFNGQWGFINEGNEFTLDENEAYYSYDWD